jgi:hypothetical protein
MAKIKVAKKKVLEAIKQAHGMKTGVCELLGISRPTLDRYLLDADIAEAMDFARVRLKDRAEYKLAEAIERGEAWAIQFALKNAKDREYSDKLDVTTNGEKLGTIGVIPIDYRAGLADLAPRPVSDSDASGEDQDAGDGSQVG